MSLLKPSLHYQQRLFQSGASLVEFLVVAPTLLFTMLGLMQTGMVFHAKSNLNYAAFEAARAGSVGHGDSNAIRAAFTRAMVGYYGGGRDLSELATATAKAVADITPASMQVKLLSPTKESFDDYASPRLAQKYATRARVIPNNNLSALTCPPDNANCNNNPNTNHSGQTLSDANILRIQITYGIPATKQIPLAGRFYVMVLNGLSSLGIAAETDPFKLALLQDGRIPMVVHTTLRMQSDPIENGNVSNPGRGNQGVPTPPVTDPGTANGGGNGTGGSGSGGGSTSDDADPADCDPAVEVECAPKPSPCAADTISEDVSSDVLFTFGSAELSAEGKVELDKIVATLNAEKSSSYRTDQIFITGYADKIGDDTLNLNLSQSRAEAVKEYLLAHLNDDVDVTIQAEGKGEQDPKTSPGVCTDAPTESNKANCAPDRRVSILRKLATFDDSGAMVEDAP
jgi:outer membrane protein OmpA-like peptidoglycan-associated protein